MPCSKGMTKCYAGCLHRQMVQEYYAAREAAEREQEARTLLGRGELELEAENGKRLITFKRWLRGHARVDHDDPAPHPLAQGVYESW